MDVWLASNSPRRYALLEPLFPDLHHEGLQGVDETPPSGTVEQQVGDLCGKNNWLVDTAIEVGLPIDRALP